jgi:hypothetical protein
MKKKLRKFSEGGFGTSEGKNKMIDEDTRSNAMKYVEGASEESRDIGAPVTRAASKSTSSVSKTVAPPTKPSVDMDAEKARMESLVKKQALERVEPENYVPGPGMIKNLFKMGAQRLAKNSADDVASAASRVAKNDAAETAVRTRAANVRGEANDAASTAVRNRAAKVRTEANDAAETAVRNRAATVRGDANDAASTAVRTRANKVQNEANDIKEAKLRVRASKTNDAASKSVRARANKALEGMKAGGKVSSASRRADGCCVRGKTKA